MDELKPKNGFSRSSCRIDIQFPGAGKTRRKAFRRPEGRSISASARIHENSRQLKIAGGHDMNFVLNGFSSEQLRLAARVFDSGSGRTLIVTTNQPGLPHE
jgi:galactose mutarotase-like enzyme